MKLMMESIECVDAESGEEIPVLIVPKPDRGRPSLKTLYDRGADSLIFTTVTTPRGVQIHVRNEQIAVRSKLYCTLPPTSIITVELRLSGRHPLVPQVSWRVAALRGHATPPSRLHATRSLFRLVAICPSHQRRLSHLRCRLHFLFATNSDPSSPSASHATPPQPITALAERDDVKTSTKDVEILSFETGVPVGPDFIDGGDMSEPCEEFLHLEPEVPYV